MSETRQIVVPGERIAEAGELRPGQNAYQEADGIYALRLGVKSVRGDRVNVIALSGRYEPARGDMVIGTVAEAGPSNWYINIGAANDVGMHVNDVPWRVEFGETKKYLDIGDSVLLKIVHVDELKKAQVSMKDRQCRKLTGGILFEVSPAKVPRIVGRQGSMISMLKDATDVRVFVGQNGVIWLDGEPEDVTLALEALRKIEAEAHTTGLTDRMKAWLEERRPSERRTHRARDEDEETPAMEEERDERPPRREERRSERPERRERREDRRDERPRGRDRDEDEGRDERPPRRERRDDDRGPRGRPESAKKRFQREDDEDEEETRPVRRFRDEEDEEERPRARRPFREEREERPRGRARDDERGPPPRRAPRDEEDDYAPRPVRRAPRDDEDDDRPARRVRDEDEEDDAPRRREHRGGGAHGNGRGGKRHGHGGGGGGHGRSRRGNHKED